MKKIKFTAVALVGLVTIATITPSVAKAGDTSSEANGTGTITYQGKNTPTDPVDPENPDNPDPVTPVDPDNPDTPNPPTNEVGPLSIDYITPLRFGTQNTTASSGKYYASGDGLKKADGTVNKRGAYVQVSDLRGDSPLKGWTLTAQMTKQFTATASTSSVLKGATLDYTNIWANGVGTTMPTAAATQQLSFDSDTNTGNTATFATAAAGSGFGTYTIEFGSFTGNSGGGNGTSPAANTNANSVILNVPAAQSLVTNDQYVATIKWTLATL